jgi:hypothetical protein
MASATDFQLSRCVHTRPFSPRARLSPSALAYESLSMTCTYARPGLTAEPTAARLQVQGVRVHPQQGPHHLGACRLDRGHIGCGLHPCEWRCPSPPTLDGVSSDGGHRPTIESEHFVRVAAESYGIIARLLEQLARSGSRCLRRMLSPQHAPPLRMTAPQASRGGGAI